MRRDLGSFERAQAITGENAPFNTVAAVRLRPSPTPESVRRSLAELVRRRPLLGAAMVRNSRGRHRFEVAQDPPTLPFQVLDRVDERTWRGAVERELQERIPSEEGPLVRCLLIRGADPAEPGELVLTIHHAVIDISSGLATLSELIEGCGGEPQEGGPENAGCEVRGPSHLPPCADAGFPDSLTRGAGGFARRAGFFGRQLADELSYRFRMRGHPKTVVKRENRCRILPTALSRQATDALLRRCRSERVTVNCVLNAAMLQAVQRGLHGNRQRLQRYMIFADLRPFLDPPVAPGTSGCVIAVIRHTVETRPEEDLWSFARRIQDQLARAARRGDKYLSSIFSPSTIGMLFRQSSSRMGTVALSYTGPTDLPHRIGGFDVESFHTFASNFGHGPEYTAQSRLREGRIWWDIVYLDGDMDATTAGAIATDLLRRLGQTEE